MLRSGKIIRQCLIKFKNYPFKDERWMQDVHFKDNVILVNDYNKACQEQSQNVYANIFVYVCGIKKKSICLQWILS